MPNPVIRKATMKDANRIIELLIELGRPEPKQNETKHFARLIQSHTSGKGGTILVAEVDSKVIGMISLVFLQRLNRIRPEAWVPELIVDEDYRNKGIGRDLLKRCIEIAKERKCWRIRLETGLTRERAQKFYKLMGMEPFALAFMLSL
jgi:GNAT superfamily N-acetyltransferase